MLPEAWHDDIQQTGWRKPLESEAITPLLVNTVFIVLVVPVAGKPQGKAWKALTKKKRQEWRAKSKERGFYYNAVLTNVDATDAEKDRAVLEAKQKLIDSFDEMVANDATGFVVTPEHEPLVSNHYALA